MKILDRHKMRNDPEGLGHFGAGRSGNRMHRAVDLLSVPGEPVFAPHDGIYRNSLVKASRPDMKMVAVKTDDGHETKLMYVRGIHANGTRVVKGQVIGHALPTGELYKLPKMLPHVHVEHWQFGKRVDPTPFILPCAR